MSVTAADIHQHGPYVLRLKELLNHELTTNEFLTIPERNRISYIVRLLLPFQGMFKGNRATAQERQVYINELSQIEEIRKAMASVKSESMMLFGVKKLFLSGWNRSKCLDFNKALINILTASAAERKLKEMPASETENVNELLARVADEVRIEREGILNTCDEVVRYMQRNPIPNRK